jgi:hypothetical protein
MYDVISPDIFQLFGHLEPVSYSPFTLKAIKICKSFTSVLLYSAIILTMLMHMNIFHLQFSEIGWEFADRIRIP